MPNSNPMGMPLLGSMPLLNSLGQQQYQPAAPQGPSAAQEGALSSQIATPFLQQDALARARVIQQQLAQGSNPNISQYVLALLRGSGG